MTDPTEKILRRNDRGEYPDEISDALDVSLSTVYAVLREHRPKRERKPRPCTSDLPDKIRGLFYKKKWKRSRIAKVLGVSRQYVYRILPAS